MSKNLITRFYHLFSSIQNLLFLILCLLPLSTQAKQFLDPSTLKENLSSQETKIAIEKLSLIQRDLNSSKLILFANDIQNNTELNKVTQEMLLYKIAESLHKFKATPALREFAQQLERYESQVFVNLDDGHHQTVTLYTIAAKAKASFYYWQQQDVILKAKTIITHAQYEKFDSLDLKNKAITDGINTAIKQMPSEQIIGLKTWVRGKLNKPHLVNTALLLAKKTQDYSLYLQLVSQFGTTEIQKTLTDLPFSEQQNYDLLKQAVSNPLLASTAIYQMSKIHSVNNDVTAYLFELLKHKQLGGSAAVALSKIATLTTLEELSKQLDNSDDNLLKSRILLTLNLINTALSKEILGAFINNPKQPEHQREEVKQWLL